TPAAKLRTSSRHGRAFLRSGPDEKFGSDPARGAPAGFAARPGRSVATSNARVPPTDGRRRTARARRRARRARSLRAELSRAAELPAVLWKSVESGYLPISNLVQQRVVGELQTQRGHRNHFLVQHRIAVAARNVLVLILAAADPVVLAAARIDILDHVVPIRVLSELGDGVAARLDSTRDVDVHQQ